MKHIRLFKSENEFNEECSMLPNPWVAYIDAINKVEYSYKYSILPDVPLPDVPLPDDPLPDDPNVDEPSVDGEPSWISYTYEIPRGIFTEYPTLTLVRGRGLVNAYKINGVEADIEPEQIVTAEGEIFQPLEFEGVTFYLPSLAACPYGADITTATTFTLNRPLDVENDWILMYETDDSGMPINMDFMSCVDYGIEYLPETFTFSDDGMSYTYSEDVVGYWNAEMSDVRVGCFFIDAEYANSLNDGPMNPPTLTTSAVMTTITGGVGDITIDESVLDSNDRCIVEYRIDDETKVFSSKFSEALFWLKSVDYSQYNINRPCMIPYAMFSGATELENVVFNPNSNIKVVGDDAFAECTKLTSVVLPDNVTCIGNCAFHSCSSLVDFNIPNKISSIMYQAFANCHGLTSLTIPSSITNLDNYVFENCIGLKTVIINDGITYIGSWTFGNCKSLTSLIIPDSVTSIADHAFNGCSGLTNVTIGNGVTEIGAGAFGACTSLPVIDNIRYADTCLVSTTDDTQTSYTIKEGTKWICDEAFAYCTGLTSINIPDSVTSIGERAFVYCTGLTSINIPDSVTSIGDYAFSDCTSLPVIDNIRYADTCLVEVVDKSLTTYTIKEGTKLIGERAFYACTGLTSINIPDSVTSIGEKAFAYYCSGLTSVTIGSGVTSIGYDAFYGCTGLTSIVIPDSVTSIGERAFGKCSSLTSIVIPDSVTNIGEGAFCDCSGLTSVTIGDGITEIKNDTFSGCTSLPVIDNIRYADTCLVKVTDDTQTSYTIKEGTKWICDEAFYNCTNLTSIVIPESVTSIGFGAFWGCSSLTSITIPENVIFIGDRAFTSCHGLTSITIGSGVTSIGFGGYELFSGCESLSSITVNNSIANQIYQQNMFDYLPLNGTLYYPKGSDYSTWLALLPNGWVGVEMDV